MSEELLYLDSKTESERKHNRFLAPIGAQLEDLQEEKLLLEKQEQLLMQKAVKGGSPMDLIAVDRLTQRKKGLHSKTKSMIFDPDNLNDNLGWKQKPFNISPSLLRSMGKTHIARSIVTRRVNQVASFCVAQSDEFKIGWSVRPKRATMFPELHKELSDEEKFEIENVINFIENSGINQNRWMNFDFESFVRLITADSMILDQVNFEVQQTRGRKPYSYFPVDAGLIKLSQSYQNHNPREDQVSIEGYYPFYAQVWKGIVHAEYYPWEMAFGVRNLSTNIWNNGYGNPELEDCIRLVTWMLNADEYNGRFFTQGSNPKGVFNVKGITEDSLVELRQQIRAQMVGVQGAWRIPVIGAEGFEWIDMQMSNQDMQFSQWQEYLLKLFCSLYSIDPAEIGFFNLGNPSGVTYESNQDYRLKYSRYNGLFPLLKFLAKIINKMIVGPLTNYRYEFYWTGLDEELEDSQIEADIKRLESGIYSWQEIRKKYKLPDSLSQNDFLLNPIWMQLMQIKMGVGNDSSQFVDEELGEGDNTNPFLSGQTSGGITILNKQLTNSSDSKNPFMKGLKDHMNKMIASSKEGKSVFEPKMNY